MVDRPLSIGVTCFPTFGGSGIVATEIGMALAQRGHQLHFICADVPWRFDAYVPNVFFHEVQARDYPLFDSSPYALALTSKMVEVSQRHQLDVLHVHYAIPHAASAYLARQILKAQAPALVTTLHGTDITVVGNDPSFLPVTRFSIEESDVVTTPSQALKQATYENLGLPTTKQIVVIPNFVDTNTYRPVELKTNRRQRLIHSSNFRRLKRVDLVIEIFAKVRAQLDCELVLIGDGPERSAMERLVQALGLTEHVHFLGKQHQIATVLAQADVFLLPSETESFGLAALEALSCGVPVVAFAVGGLPELVVNGEVGVLCPPGDTQAMAFETLRILKDPARHRRLSLAARAHAVESFQRTAIIDAYQNAYHQALQASRRR
jgi:L-malate glycosyltransferase